ncbi:MAG: ParB/RepB/Spo0J family partition protein [Oscillospiraceae bacterium]|jgi:ParB family chromosome partitioning protein|nr:ParB/RepB/Spo0J family partition protein [Oscillospiraceae bacterium]
MKQKVLYLPVAEISPNPMQPRRFFEPTSLAELCESIKQYGILQPLNVRKSGKYYELIAGERRLRAARLAGLSMVPCLINDVDPELSSLIAMVENLQRKDLDYIDEAEGIARLIKAYGLSQEEAARKLGKAQSSVANKLRLLKLAPELLYVLRENGLSERHARALLRLDTNDERIAVLRRVIDEKLTVAGTEALVEEFTALSKNAGRGAIAAEEAPPEIPPDYPDISEAIRRRKVVVKDVRIFLNTIAKCYDTMKAAGIGAEYGRNETESEILLTIKIPK